MPPLRDRFEDIHLLAMYFLKKAVAGQMKRNGRQQPLRLSRGARMFLSVYNWPGNIRQLEQAIFAAAAICEGNQIRPEDFPGWLQHAVTLESEMPVNQPQSNAAIDASFAMKDSSSFDLEHTKYLHALASTKYPGTGRWNLSAAARELDIPRKTFTYRLKKLGLIR